jgi:hypothetical protein
MKQDEKKEGKRHVIEKIRRISLAMDRGESWNWILLVGLLTLVALGLLFFFFL